MNKLEEEITIKIKLYSGHDYNSAQDVWSWIATLDTTRKNIPIEKLRDSSGKTPIEAATKILQDYTNLILQKIYSS
jgi:ribosomal protein S24E